MTEANRKITTQQYLFTIIALVLAITMVFIFSGSKNAAPEQAIVSEPSFGSNNFCVMKKDTFTALVGKAYGSLAIVTWDGQRLYIDLKNTGQSARDFFNGNDLLLKHHINDSGFEINYDREKQAVHAAFKVDARNAVNVPDDILIKLMEKSYNK